MYELCTSQNDTKYIYLVFANKKNTNHKLSHCIQLELEFDMCVPSEQVIELSHELLKTVCNEMCFQVMLGNSLTRSQWKSWTIIEANFHRNLYFFSWAKKKTELNFFKQGDIFYLSAHAQIHTFQALEINRFSSLDLQ